MVLWWCRPLHSLVGLRSFCPSFPEARLSISCRYTWELPTWAFELELPQFPMTRLNLVLFEPEVLQFPEDRPTLFLLVVIHRMDWRSRSLWRDTFFALTAHHQIGGSDICHWRPTTRVWVLSSFRHGANHNALSGLRERTFEIAWTRICRKTHYVEYRRWFHSSFEKLPLVRMSASWFLVSTNLTWILGSKLNDPTKLPIKSDSVSSRHTSQRGTSSSIYHLDHGFVVIKDVVPLRFPLRRTCVGGYVIYLIQSVNFLFSVYTLSLGFGIINCRVG